MHTLTDEYNHYHQAKVIDSSSGKFQSALSSGATVWTCAMIMRLQLAACSEGESKLQALVDDLKELQREDPHMHAVVFTQSVRHISDWPSLMCLNA